MVAVDASTAWLDTLLAAQICSGEEGAVFTNRRITRAPVM